MGIHVKVKTLDSHTYEFSLSDEITVRQFKDLIADETNIAADQQRIIYCGKVLSDEKFLREYDVNGKVVHVVERPPPSRAPASSNSTNRRIRNNESDDSFARGFMRGLDGMVVGAMTIPVNASGSTQPSVPQLNPSSSFCVNRITVARHMLECANNIAAYLENPERGLNNTSLDILAQARWTMESTVVEVGISTAENIEIPQNQQQNIVEALQGAVSAAFRQNGHPNVTVVQIPPIFGANGGTATAVVSSQVTSSDSEGGSSRNNENISTSEQQPMDESVNESEATGTNETNENQTNNTTNESLNSSANSPTRQNTGTRILAEVIDQMRAVQTRLEPFVQQYYDILLNDPQFNENETTSRENSQRVFDRVSEAFHYLSHAQHAISDLMLDLSQPTPRYLCCRPILVEQSGFVSANNMASLFQPTNGNNNESNNNGSAAFARSFMRSTSQQEAQQQQQPQQSTANNTLTEERRDLNSEWVANFLSEIARRNSRSDNSNSPLISLSSLPPSLPLPFGIPSSSSSPLSTTTSTTPATTNENSNSNRNSNNNQERQAIAEIVVNLPPRRLFIPNSQLQVARLIEAVVNSSSLLDADVHFHINAPNVVSIGIPITQASQPTQTTTLSQQTRGTASSSNTTNAEINNSNTSASNQQQQQQQQARVTTATHPTTSTQTRSTARPQLHIGSMPPPQMWNTRIIPANMVSSFDRFLPCSSHHIHENESTNNSASNDSLRSRSQTQQRSQQQQRQQSSANPSSSNNMETSSTPNILPASDLPFNLFGHLISVGDILNFTPNPIIFNRIRQGLRDFVIDTFFNGASINEDNMDNGINNVIRLINDALLFLPQFELSDYDSRASVENFMRRSLPVIINLINEDDSNEFGTRFMNFVQRLFVIIVTCIGRENAELYLNQVTQMVQMALTRNQVVGREVLYRLQRHFLAALLRELDIMLQSANDVQEFLVIRRPNIEQQHQVQSEVTPMETEEISEQSEKTIENNTTTNQSSSSSRSEQQVPSGSTNSNTTDVDMRIDQEFAASQVDFPTNWLPVIIRDMEKQKQQSPQKPFSDAYISGMSAKRRKIIMNSKPSTDIQYLIKDGVTKAIKTASNASSTARSAEAGPSVSGLSLPGTSTSSALAYDVEEISTAISTDPAAQLSYREALRSSIQQRLQSDSDYVPHKFPNSSKYFKK